ncbi:hypothetical protein HanPSC8_Chr11g0461851 [Helianthus annuus]|nr:hypothetical protein HanPSC8_Chr11g0461851 [Helianthus annuus]
MVLYNYEGRRTTSWSDDGGLLHDKAIPCAAVVALSLSLLCFVTTMMVDVQVVLMVTMELFDDLRGRSCLRIDGATVVAVMIWS